MGEPKYCQNCKFSLLRTGAMCPKIDECHEQSEWVMISDPAPDEFDRPAPAAPLGNKETTGKVPVELIPWAPVLAMCQVLQFGAQKYEDWNWYKGVPMMSLMGSILRHSFKWICGEDNDTESGLPHPAHIMCNCAFILQFILEGRKELDNRKSMPGLMDLLPIIDTELWSKYAKKGMK